MVESEKCLLYAPNKSRNQHKLRTKIELRLNFAHSQKLILPCGGERVPPGEPYLGIRVGGEWERDGAPGGRSSYMLPCSSLWRGCGL